MGRKSKEEGMYVHMWLIHFAVQQKLTQHCKATVLQFKKKRLLVGELPLSHSCWSWSQNTRG